MRGIDFPEATMNLNAPEGMEDEVYVLRAWHVPGHAAFISKWKMTWLERLMCLWQGYCWLHVMGTSHPPVTIETDYPFEREKVPFGHGIRRSVIFIVLLVLLILIGAGVIYFGEVQ